MTAVPTRTTAQTTSIFPPNEKVKSVGKITDDYDKILPFGGNLKPILASSILSATDLKDFLKRKGIFIKHADKELIVPIFANLLLSPIELDYLKGLLIDKEEKPKSINRSALFIGKPEQLKEVVRQLQLKGAKLKANCEHLQEPRKQACANFAHIAAAGKTCQVEHYKLDVITSVGYRAKSKRGTHFRIWTTRVLRKYLVEGYVLNERRLKEQEQNLSICGMRCAWARVSCNKRLIPCRNPGIFAALDS